jgi:hypothetical protein
MKRIVARLVVLSSLTVAALAMHGAPLVFAAR